jgi:hypothetical protein
MRLASNTRFVTFAMIAVVVFAVSAANGQNNSQGPGMLAPRAGAAPAVTATRHLPIGTLFDASSPGAAASCSSAGCSAFASIYSETVTCPRSAGATCTFQVTIHSQVNAGSNDSTLGEEGVYQFLVDGAAPTPGPVGNACSCFAWSGSSRQFSLPIRAASYAVTATVTNTTNNQAHPIAVNIGCNEVHGNASGCFANSGFANLSITTYVP